MMNDMNDSKRQLLKLSERSPILSSENSFDIQVMILLIIIHESTDNKQYVSFNKVSFIYSSIINNTIFDFELKTKDILPAWEVLDLKKQLLYGELNDFWSLTVKSGKIMVSRSSETSSMYDHIVREKAFSEITCSIKKLSKIAAAKIDRQRLV